MSTGALLLLATSLPVALPPKPTGLTITSVTETSVSASWNAISSADRVGLEVTGEHVLAVTERGFSTGIGRWASANNAHDPAAQTLQATVPAVAGILSVRFPVYASTLESGGAGSMDVRLVGAGAGRTSVLYVSHYDDLGNDSGIIPGTTLALTSSFASTTVNDPFPSRGEVVGGTTEFVLRVSNVVTGDVIEIDNASLVRASRTMDVPTATSGTKTLLQSSTQYSVVAYAENAGGIVRSDPIQITTLGVVLFAAFGIPL